MDELNEKSIDEALESVGEEAYPEIIELACELLARVSSDRTPTRVLFDLLEATCMDDIKDTLYKVYGGRK